MRTNKHVLKISYETQSFPEDFANLLDVIHAKLFIKNRKIFFQIILIVIIGIIKLTYFKMLQSFLF